MNEPKPNADTPEKASSPHEVGSRLAEIERRYLLARKEEDECRKHINYLRRDLTKLSRIRADLSREYKSARESATEKGQR